MYVNPCAASCVLLATWLSRENWGSRLEFQGHGNGDAVVNSNNGRDDSVRIGCTQGGKRGEGRTVRSATAIATAATVLVIDGTQWYESAGGASSKRGCSSWWRCCCYMRSLLLPLLWSSLSP